MLSRGAGGVGEAGVGRADRGPGYRRPGPMSTSGAAPTLPGSDAESRAWLAGLRDPGPAGEATRERLHDLLLRAARFEIARRRSTLRHLRGDDFDDLAH